MIVKIFYGPVSEFKKFVSQDVNLEDGTSLTELIIEYDRLLKNESYNYIYNPLVVYSDNYSNIKESFIGNFYNIITNFPDINEVYLQNPPKQVVNSILDNNKKDTEISYYSYQKLDKSKFLEINSKFNERIIGQEKVKKLLLTSLYPLIKNDYSGKPIILLFYGNSGIGKTETAVFLSEILGEKLFRKQFSMFQNEKFAEYLFGGSPGISSFAKDLLNRESNIILLDEFDKSANIFYEAFYQIFDEGIFEDTNYNVDLKNTIIICTSNFQNKEEIRKTLSDPLYYRFNNIIKFDDFDDNSLKRIILKIINNKYEKLDESDKKLIDIDEIKNFLYNHVSQLNNYREISNEIGMIMNQKIVENFINRHK